MVKFLKKATNALFRGVTDEVFDMHTEQAVHYCNLKESVEEFNDNVTEQFSSVDHNLTTLTGHMNQFVQSFNKLVPKVENIHELVKEDPELTTKLLKASKIFVQQSASFPELVTLLKSLDLQSVGTSVNTM